MGRAPVSLRPAGLGDLPVLHALWADLLRPDASMAATDLQTLLARSVADDGVRIVVADVDGQVAGAVLLVVSPVTPLNPELFVHAFAPQVVDDARRRGVGLALMDAAATFAEDQGIALVGAAAYSTSRDANRFFARLGMGSQAVLRIATTGAVRQRISSLRPARPAERRHVDRVLAARRGRRSARAAS